MLFANNYTLHFMCLTTFLGCEAFSSASSFNIGKNVVSIEKFS